MTLMAIYPATLLHGNNGTRDARTAATMTSLIHLDAPDSTAKLFGDRLKAKRKQLGLNQGDFAKKADVTATYISLTERGLANPTLEMMVKLASAAEVEVWNLLHPMRRETE